VTVCLEATAGQGSNLGYTFEQLAYMIDKVEDKSQIGVCVDTCHIFAAGYPITEPSDYKKTMKQFSDIVGLDKLRVLHLNDSKKELGAKVDRHEHIGQGKIGIEAFRNILNDKKLAKIPMIIETPKEEDLEDDIKNLALLRSLIKT
jgi:deoxyribonuclease-4